MKQRVSQHQSAVKGKANSQVKEEVGSPGADEELERRTLGLSISSSALEVEMASIAGEAAVAEPDPQEPNSAMKIARRPAPRAQKDPPVENRTVQAATAKGAHQQ